MMNFSLLNDSQGQEIEFLRLNYYCNYSKFDHYVTFLNFGVGISAILSLLVYIVSSTNVPCQPGIASPVSVVAERQAAMIFK